MTIEDMKIVIERMALVLDRVAEQVDGIHRELIERRDIDPVSVRTSPPEFEVGECVGIQIRGKPTGFGVVTLVTDYDVEVELDRDWGDFEAGRRVLVSRYACHRWVAQA